MFYDESEYNLNLLSRRQWYWQECLKEEQVLIWMDNLHWILCSVAIFSHKDNAQLVMTKGKQNIEYYVEMSENSCVLCQQLKLNLAW